MRPIQFLLTAVWLCFTATLHATEETCAACDRKILVTGEFQHSPANNMATFTDATPRQAAPYREEIYGKQFSVIIPNLAAGKYTVVLGFAETWFTNAGEREFDVTCGSQTLATNLDIFAKVGWAKIHRLTVELEHLGDALTGPLTFTFTGKKQFAKLNTLEIRDTPKHAVVSVAAADLVPVNDPELMKIPVIMGAELWKDPAQSIAARALDLLDRLTPAEKIALMRNGAPRIERLGIPSYDQWNECLHGVARAGIATVFPQAIGMAAAWDAPLMQTIGDVIATEGRAKNNEYAAKHQGDSARYYGLTFWTPNINIFRDPRWGRGQETYGEDPFLAARLAVPFIHGLQGDDPDHLKAMGCAKHFAVHSGPESNRHHFDVAPGERDLYETYLPQFEVAVREGKVGAVMGAYNRVFNEPACSSEFLLNDILRKQWGFTGHVVSDCGAITDIFANHKTVSTAEEASARAVKAGCDLCCGTDYNALARALKQGLLTRTDLDTAVSRLLAARFRLGLFDTPETNPLLKISPAANDTPAHQAVALRAARESIVLLQNNGVLPLDRQKLKRLLVLGANADSEKMLLGNYNGTPSKAVTVLAGLRELAGAGIEVTHIKSDLLALPRDGKSRAFTNELAAAVAAATNADVVIYVGGISPQLEGEEMKVSFDGFTGGDRTRIELPSLQTDFLRALHATGKPVVFVNCSGSAIAMPWEKQNLPAILQAWYPGQSGGRAVAEILFGDVNPSGRLPVTFYESTQDLPPFEDYAMSNRTYRYFTGQPLFAFGHGLSYTQFKYADAQLADDKVFPDGKLKLTVTVQNTGARAGEEVVQVYFRHVHPAVPQARQTLCGFQRVNLAAGQSATVTLEIPASQFRFWDVNQKRYVVSPGKYELLLGGASDDVRVKLPVSVR